MSHSFAIPWTIASHAPLSMEFPRQESWSGLQFPSPGDLPDPGIELQSPALQADTLPSESRGKPYDPAIPLLGIYPENTTIQKDTCSPMFIATLFTIARTWKQPKCPSTEEGIKVIRYMYTMEYYWSIKKSKIMPLGATWMDLEIVILSEVSQTQKDEHHTTSFMCGILKQKKTLEF